MMREILFRGKRVDNGEWTEAQTFMCAKNVDGSEETFYLGARNPMIQYDDKFGNIGILETDTSSPIFYKVIPETVGQYTGLTDKYGNKIFEGDIVNILPEVDEIGVIEWADTEAMFRIEADHWSADFDNYYPIDLEVIGNIHDNPDLL